MAIAIAREYKNRMRSEMSVSIDSLIRASGRIQGEALPFAEHVDRILARVTKDEQPSESTRDDWNNDATSMKEFFDKIPAWYIDLEHVNTYIKEYHTDSSANVQNRKVSFLKKLFSYAVYESLMLDNPATRKKIRRIEEKKRQRLSFDNFMTIRRAAAPWLRTAMDLPLQTTHARLEISRVRYSIREPKNGVCGCVWLDQPLNSIHGNFHINRQKVQKKRPRM